MATFFNNQATSNTTIDGQTISFSSNTVTAELFDNNSVTLTKSQDKSIVVSGSTITYSVAINNLATSAVSNFNFEDIIPVGMSYVSNSFKVNGTSQTPTVTGQNLSYTIATLATGITTVSFECSVA